MENQEISTIKLRKETKARLDHLKIYSRETYEEILSKMLNILNLVKVNPEEARARLMAIDKQKRRNQLHMKEIKKDAIKPQVKEVRKE
jgi:DNA-binding protein H-NS